MAYIGPSYLGRYTKGDTITWKFTLTVADVPTTLGSTPAIKAYEAGSDVEFTGGISFTADYDSKTGLVEVIVDTSNGAYSAGKEYDFFISAGAIGAVNPVGYCVGHIALIPEPADLRKVNGGSTGAAAGKLELAQLKIHATGSDNALDIEAVNGNAIWAKASNNLTVYMDSGANTTIDIDNTSGLANGAAVLLYNGNGGAVSTLGDLQFTAALGLQGPTAMYAYGREGIAAYGYGGQTDMLGPLGAFHAYDGMILQPDYDDHALFINMPGYGSGGDGIHITTDGGKYINADGKEYISVNNIVIS